MRGSVKKRGDSYRARVKLPKGDGTRAEKSATFRTKKEAEEWVRRVIGEAEKGYHVSTHTAGQYLSEWLQHVSGTVEIGTAENYATNVHRITERIGGLFLGKLTPMDIQRFANNLPADWSPFTRRDVYKVLHMALRQAVKWRLLPYDPSAGVKAPPVPKREMTVWTKDEAERFLAAANENRFGALFRLTVMTGMRQGELLGLRWSDVDFETGMVQVTHSLVWPAHQPPQLKNPKTRSSQRRIPLDAETLDVLRVHRVRQLKDRLAAGPEWEDLDLVFPGPNGGYQRKKSLGQNMRPICRKADVPVIRFHDLRHTQATLLLAANVHPKVVAERLGHSRVGITLDVYSHVQPDMQREAVQALENLFKK